MDDRKNKFLYGNILDRVAIFYLYHVTQNDRI